MKNAQGHPGCHSTTVKDSPFIGITLPMGVRSEPKESVKIAVSLCVNINKCFTGFSTETGNSKQDFYDRLKSLGVLLTGDPSLNVFVGTSLTCMAKLDKVSKSSHPLQYAMGELVRDHDHLALRKKLWGKVFPSGRTINPESRVPNPSVVGKVTQLISEENLPAVMGIMSGEANKNIDSPGIFEKLKNMRDFAGARAKRAQIDKLEFYNKYKPATLKSLIEKLDKGQLSVKDVNTVKQFADEFADIHQKAIGTYADDTCPEIEIDDVIHSFSALSNEPAIMRLMGLILDVEIDLPPQFIPKPGSPIYFYIMIKMDNTEDIGIIPTKIKAICNNDRTKYAYLVAEDEDAVKKEEQFFENSILKVETVLENKDENKKELFESGFCVYDKVAQEFRLQGIRDAIKNDSGAVGDDPCDAFTRGIIFCNTGLHRMVTPVSMTCDKNGAVSKPLSFTESYVSHGHRVGAVICSEYYSLTGRRLELSQIQSSCREPFFVSDLNEGPIHCDAVSNFLGYTKGHEDEGLKPQSAVSDALFEYSGELLSLKSVFSRFKRTTKADVSERASYSHDDGGLDKTKARISKAINFTYFPADPENCKSESEKPCFFLSCHYDLPHHFTPTHSPKLRFYTHNEPRTYTFVVSQEYLNGWGLPLETLKAFPFQLSVKDLTEADSKKFLPKPIPFDPLECKRPVLLFHTKDPERSEMIRNEPLETLVIWSEDADSCAHSSSRHVLPARIAMEHALWYGLLERMPGDESCIWKHKYNCPFLSQEEYNTFTNGKERQQCPENGCSFYCGGTAMRPFYGEGSIVPNHLSDPSVVGFSVLCFRDKACQKRLFKSQAVSKFEGIPGLEPTSCRLIAEGVSKGDDNEIYVSDFTHAITLRVKQGMTIWVQLKNVISEDYAHHLASVWYRSPALPHKLGSTAQVEKEKKNPPRLIKIIHAVKKPVISPEIKAFSSKPREDYKHSHIQEWLHRDYPGLTLDSNVVVDRVKTDVTDQNSLGSSITAVKLRAKFERLDAFWEDGKVAFLDDELPTGSLELWMRKEEYIDNPEQVVFRSDSQQGALFNQLPNQPVVSFDNRSSNHSHRDFRVEFDANVMHQLKVHPVSVGDPKGDIVRELTSTLHLQFDARSTKFEERRYILRNMSLFKGYFTDKEDDLKEEYVSKSPEFRVLLLNNRKPEKPEVSHAVTTIQEERQREGNITTTRQRGNIVTIYLKRGRLSSGKNERVGVVVYNDNSRYHSAWLEANLISKAGRDIVSDPSIPTASPFIRYDPTDVTKQDIILSDTNEFDGRFHEDLGIVSYLPQFDASRNLWKFEIELDIKTADGSQLHNPFVVFSLVHFQPFSVNYNPNCLTKQSSISDMSQDLRISAAEPFIWCYLLPERRLSVSFQKPGLFGLGPWTDIFEPRGRVELTISFDKESLHFYGTGHSPLLRSNFILSVEGSDDKVAWYPVMSQVYGKSSEWALMHPLLTNSDLHSGKNEAQLKLRFLRESNPSASGNKEMPSQKFCDFRVRLVEVEWFVEKDWGEMNISQYMDVTENQELRVRYVELIY